ncbi:holo-ACP synthase [Actinomyces radicidentis]|uniref:holo-ACP synthase n=1 Tax=Actinomyces radicidentis TaxID=111015 RepID=UPI0009FDB19A|nr:holo-ACP synthase [Actinomyces radicidentis]
MIIAVGTDLVDVARLEARLRRAPALASRLLTAEELAVCAGRTESVAARLAAKESALKALGSALAAGGERTPRGWSFQEIEVRGGRGAAPVLRLSGVAAATAARLGARRWHLALAHDARLAQAFVVAEG